MKIRFAAFIEWVKLRGLKRALKFPSGLSTQRK
jgi:hypothetical protein